jgi:hypothetical protein
MTAGISSAFVELEGYIWFRLTIVAGLIKRLSPTSKKYKSKFTSPPYLGSLLENSVFKDQAPSLGKLWVLSS